MKRLEPLQIYYRAASPCIWKRLIPRHEAFTPAMRKKPILPTLFVLSQAFFKTILGFLPYCLWNYLELVFPFTKPSSQNAQALFSKHPFFPGFSSQFTPFSWWAVTLFSLWSTLQAYALPCVWIFQASIPGGIFNIIIIKLFDFGINLEVYLFIDWMFSLSL